MKSKRYRSVSENIDLKKRYHLLEAINFLQLNNFESSKNVEISVSLNWDSKQKNIRDSVIIPHPVKTEKIAIIDSEVPSEVRQRKDILFVSFEELPRIIAKKKKKGWGFEKLFAHTSLADQLKPFAKKLSLKKSYPNSKDGTLTDDLNIAVRNWELGKIEIRNDKNGNFHTLVGKTSFESKQIESNYQVVLDKIISLKPVNWKGAYLRSVTISTTMGPGLKLSF